MRILCASLLCITTRYIISHKCVKIRGLIMLLRTFMFRKFKTVIYKSAASIVQSNLIHSQFNHYLNNLL